MNRNSSQIAAFFDRGRQLGRLDQPYYGSVVDWKHPTSAGLIAQYLFNEGSGNTAHDISRNQFDMTLTGPSTNRWRSDWPFRSALFGDRINNDHCHSAAIPNSIIAKSTHTMSIWARCTENPTTDNNATFGFAVNSSNRLYQRVCINGGDSVACYEVIDGTGGGGPTHTTAALSRIHLYTLTCNGTAWRAYTDGKFIVETPEPDLSGLVGDPVIYAGELYGAWEMKGFLHSATMWDRVLSDAEIMQLYRDPYANITYWQPTIAFSMPTDPTFSDQFFGADPTDILTTVSDVYTNNRSIDVAGDVWYDVVSDNYRDTAWDILNDSLQDIAWDIMNEHNQDTAWDILNTTALDIAWIIFHDTNVDFSWNIFARTLYYIQKFVIDSICFNYNIKEPIPFDKQIMEPLEFTFSTTDTIDDTIYLEGAVYDTVHLQTPITFDFQIMEPVQFTFGISNVLHGEETEYPG